MRSRRLRTRRTGSAGAWCRARTPRAARSTTSRSPTTRPDCSTSRTSAASSSIRCIRAAPTWSHPYYLSSTSIRSSHTRTRTCSSWHGTSRCCSTSSGCPRSRRRAARPAYRSTCRSCAARTPTTSCGRSWAPRPLMKDADPDRVTMAWKIADRTGEIFIDHNMNRSGEHRGRVLGAPGAASVGL